MKYKYLLIICSLITLLPVFSAADECRIGYSNIKNTKVTAKDLLNKYNKNYKDDWFCAKKEADQLLSSLEPSTFKKRNEAYQLKDEYDELMNYVITYYSLDQLPKMAPININYIKFNINFELPTTQYKVKFKNEIVNQLGQDFFNLIIGIPYSIANNQNANPQWASQLKYAIKEALIWEYQYNTHQFELLIKNLHSNISKLTTLKNNIKDDSF